MSSEIPCPRRPSLRPRCRRPPTPRPSSTSMNRPDHQLVPIAPRTLRTLTPPLTLRGAAGGKNGESYRRLVTDGLLRQGEKFAQACGRQLGEPTLAVADHHVRQCHLLLNHGVDAFFQRAPADELAHLHPPLLP